MRIKMSKKNGLLLACVSAIVALSGCATGPTERPKDLLDHDFTAELPQPRPKTLEQSYAMKKMYSEFTGYSPRALGCLIDTAVWEDEKDKYHGGFDLLEVFEATLGYTYSSDERKTLLENLIKKHGTVPSSMHDGIKNAQGKDLTLEFLNNSMAFADMKYFTSFENKSANGWTTEGVAISGGIMALGLLARASQRIDERNITIKSLNSGNLAYRLNPQEEKMLADKWLDEILRPKDIADISDFYAERILLAMADAVKDLGYRPTSGIVKKEEKGKEYDAEMFIPIEGKNCPKSDTEKPWNACYLKVNTGKANTFYPFFINLSRKGYKTANMILDSGYGTFFKFDLEEDNNSKEKKEMLLKLVNAMVRKNKNITYFMSFENDEGKWSPQYVLDSKGKHYFTVPVKR